MPVPSDNLVRQLSELQLCTRQDLDACEPIVRRLCQDLPDFDSVWLDALVQLRVLTPWQAGVLQSANPLQLRQDDYVLLEPLGQQTFQARHVDTRRLVVLQQVPARTQDDSQPQLSWLQEVCQQLDSLRQQAPASLALPNRFIPAADGRGGWLVSAYVPGWRLDELLIRGGRLPWAAVNEIGRDLLQAVQWLESHRLPHGEINLRNIRLRPDGRAVLVAPFVSRLLRPAVSYRADLQLRDIEYTAPELAGTARGADSRSELYSAGCVLWQLLTARSPYLSTDPLTRLLKSQEFDVPDVRTLVPDCPDHCAHRIQSLTRRSPELRPATAADVLTDWSRQCRKGHSQTRLLLRRLPDRHRHGHTVARRRRIRIRPRLTAGLLLTVCGMLLVAAGIQRGVIPATLMLEPRTSLQPTKTSPAGTATEDRNLTAQLPLDSAAAANESGPDQDGFRPLPAVDAAGTIRLTAGGLYRAAPIRRTDSLQIVNDSGLSATIMISGRGSWSLEAGQVTLRNLEIRRETQRNSSSAAATTALVEVVCNSLKVQKCVLQNDAEQATSACLKWRPAGPGPTATEFSDCVLVGSGWGLFLQHPPQVCRLDNVLLNTRRAAIRCDVLLTEVTALEFELTRVSQVAGETFLDVLLPADQSAPGILTRLSSGESVLATSVGLVRFASARRDWSPENLQVEFPLKERGNPTIVPGSVRAAVYVDSSLAPVVELKAQQTLVESLLPADPIFRGETAAAESRFARFELLDYEGPKLSTENLPGVDVSRLP